MTLIRPAQSLDVLVYCARAWRWSALFTTGRWPLTSPPLGPESFDPAWLRGHDVLFFKFHGLEGEPRWYGVEQRGSAEIWQDALDVKTIRASGDLGGCVVFAQACWSRESPMITALLETGAAAVVGSDRKLVAGRYWIQQSDWLGRYFLIALGEGLTATDALELAKRRAVKRGLSLSQTAHLTVLGDSRRRFANV